MICVDVREKRMPRTVIIEKTNTEKALERSEFVYCTLVYLGNGGRRGGGRIKSQKK